ncbi:MAG: Ig-like domain-containing protein, partial [Caldilineaceae bacterium]
MRRIVPTLAFATALLLGMFAMALDAGRSHANTAASNWSTNGPPGTTVWSLAIDPTNTNNVYAATSDGIYKSTDGGSSWIATSITGFSGNPVFVAIDPVTPTTVYASREGTLHKSTDGGANWSTITGPAPSFHRAVAVDPSTPSTLYVGIRGGQSVYKSTDGGTTWSSVYPGGSFVADMIVVDPNNSATVYAGGGSPSLFKSTDGGANWTNISSGLTGVSVRSLAIDPTNANTLYVGINGTSGGVFKSTDGGATWSASNSGLTPTDVYPVVIDPNNPNKLYAGTFGGGVFQSMDGGTSWTAFNDGLTTLNVYSFVIDPSNSENLYAGTAGGGVFIQAANAAPNAVDDTAVTSVNTPVNIAVLANDSDPDSDPLSISAVGSANNGTATISGAQIAYTPTTDFTGTGTFTYTVSDGSLTDSATVTVTVRADVGACTDKVGLIEQLQSNSSAQHANPVYASAGQSFTVPAGVMLADGITAYYTFVAANATITLNLYNGPATGNIGIPIATATYTNPGAALSETEVHFRFNTPVSLTPGNVYYYLMSPSYNPTNFGFVTATNNPYSGGTYLSGASNGTVSSSPFPDWDLKFSVFLCEPDSSAAPNAVDDTAVTSVNTPVNINVLANDTDPNGDTLSVSAVGFASNGTAAVSSAQIVYTPTTDFIGTDTFTYTVSDGGLSDNATVTVTVHAGPISLQSVNYPERHLIAKADGSSVELLDIPDNSSGGVQRRAEFLLKPGIADASMVSIQVNDSSGRYMVATSDGVVLKTLSEIINGEANSAECTPFEGWTRCKTLADPKIRIMGTARVSQSAIDIVARIYTEMAARFKPAYPKDVFNGYVVYITNGEPWSEINGLYPIGVTLGPNDEGDILRGGASRDYLWISEQMICKTGIVTRPDDTTTRTFDQVIHEFAHAIHANYGLEDRIEQIYSEAAKPNENFAWGIQHWFSSPSGTLTPEQSAFIGEIFSGSTTFSCDAYTPTTNRYGFEAAQDGTLPIPAGHVIEQGRKYVSLSGNHYLIFQEDGNLVVNTSTGNRVWALSEVNANYANAKKVQMGQDANLVVTGDGNAYIWSALTANPDPRALLSLTPNGVLQLVSDRRGVLWSSDGNLTPFANGNDATFKKVPGLIGSGMSFESIVQPNHYLRHYQFRLRLDPSNGSPLFLNDASFIEVEPLSTLPEDGNNDGIPDAQQTNVKTFRSEMGNAVTL